jgi:hypothetical protein
MAGIVVMVFARAKLKQLLIWVVVPLFLSACSVSKTNQVTIEQKHSSLPQTVIYIKHDIANDPRYRTGTGGDSAKEYINYVNWIVGQVKSKKISQSNATILLIKSYNKFKAGNYHPTKENILYEAPGNYIPPPTIPRPSPPQIPEKPGVM